MPTKLDFPVLSLDGQNRTLVIAEWLGRVIAASQTIKAFVPAISAETQN